MKTSEKSRFAHRSWDIHTRVRTHAYTLNFQLRTHLAEIQRTFIIIMYTKALIGFICEERMCSFSITCLLNEIHLYKVQVWS